MMRIRRYSSGGKRTPARPAATAAQVLLVVVAATSGLGAVSAFGLGFGGSTLTAPTPLPGRALSAAATGNRSGSGGSRRKSADMGTSMTAKPSQVFVAGATGRLGQRVVRYVSVWIFVWHGIRTTYGSSLFEA